MSGSGASYDVSDIEEAQVTFTKSKISTTWTAKENLSILQLAEKVGLKPDYGCRSGMCGTCERKILKGQVYGPEGWEPQGIYICQSKPASKEIEIDL
ncbi:hypothetical protein LTR56_003264 [Elasticomyces elasticus]|uniref:2Fe-2S ferredoxin-type domain-containing protein n=1 Tax=Elasticomyces elasticus TaxID=574655 RepID=A0AAN7W792_9PEZI|nr:hypothetical protein LTR22_013644 [Elasticomyces elasticus]KAK3656132.1 hypothetical protein LTR56_003264 [Elasticomyces elasticus]KAK4922313.1 hypothetical protein LTR49_010344 [Elasticomyces elasticus]KAK4958491.1 hypothetical protein LTR10_004919 [Elasticomyces elasticus]KAK4977234.1 hypothetical protein LTR42_003282 [Elasticomyces elasticus]